jgi:AcrR family transcriptional regulator
VSHGSVYRHFPSKAALRDAVTERWLSEISEPLEDAVTESGTAPERVRSWLDLLVTSKRRKALDDPELFATYVGLAADARGVVIAHVERLVAQLERIIADGVESREFASNDTARAARAVFDATARFHNPVHAAEWADPGIDAAYEDVRSLVLAGLSPRT